MATPEISSCPDDGLPQTPPYARAITLEGIAWTGGRALIATLFVLSGAAKILGPKPFLNHMVAVGVPTAFLPVVIALEICAGLAILVGWRVRDFAAALALFCLLTAAIFHHDLGISAERTSFFKDLAISGGLFVLASGAEMRRLFKMDRQI